LRHSETAHDTIMKTSAAGFIVAFVAATLDIGHAFSPPPSANGARFALLATVDDAAAKAMSDYMAKSHEEKLRAIKEVESKKNAEIDVSSIHATFPLLY